MKNKLLITGGAGFVGAHLVEGVLKNTDWDIIVLDRLDISGNLERLQDIENWNELKHRVEFVWWDLKAPINKHLGKITHIWHVAASSHVDRSIDDPLSFVMDNVVGTCNLLNYARKCKPKQVIYFSTDEVFGPAPNGVEYPENARYNSGNPYAASKAGGEELAVAFHNTYKLPVIITHTMNVLGERQHPEKFLPLCINKIRKQEVLKIHSNKDKTLSGTRFYIHARNVADALLFLSDKGKPGQKYNIVGEREISNLQLARMVAEIIGKPLQYEMVDFHSSRPGHDLRYALSGTKMAKMGWVHPLKIEEWLPKTVKWYLENKSWL